MEQGRSKRRSALRKTNMPSAAHYVGYVEEDETPEMIMKKFEELEKIMGGSKPAASPVEATAAAGADTLVPSSSQGLNDAQLDEIFKATSIFSVKAIMSGNEALMLKQQHAALGTCSDSGQMTGGHEHQQQQQPPEHLATGCGPQMIAGRRLPWTTDLRDRLQHMQQGRAATSSSCSSSSHTTTSCSGSTQPLIAGSMHAPALTAAAAHRGMCPTTDTPACLQTAMRSAWWMS
jgi:hypothetical protein